MKIYEHNIETGVAELRDMTADEEAKFKAKLALEVTEAAAAEQAAIEKAAILTKLGLTEAELKIALA